MIHPKVPGSLRKPLRAGVLAVFLVQSAGFMTSDRRKPPEPPGLQSAAIGVSAAESAAVRLKAATLTVAAVGDVMMAGSALEVIRQKGADYPFDSTRAAIQSADIAFANLEAPFGADGTPFPKEFTFRVPPEYSSGLVNAGFDVVNLANNHILDFGPSPFATTLRLLDSLGIAVCGAGMNLDSAESAAVVVRNGWRTAFLGFSLTYPESFRASAKKPGTAFAVRERVTRQIAEARSRCDLVIASFHWGKELHTFPEPYQREFARAAIDAGADLVLGHHPHVPQGIELYRGKPIAYSLGNFVFGSRSALTREGILFIARFDSAGFAGADAVPLCVDFARVRFQPRFLRGAERENAIRSLNTISKPLNGGREILSSSGEIRR
jgi:poly-gamma-glutamate capsule biosynthesis protein CapA/YwtB (metallophosphatase superfamily)